MHLFQVEDTKGRRVGVSFVGRRIGNLGSVYRRCVTSFWRYPELELAKSLLVLDCLIGIEQNSLPFRSFSRHLNFRKGDSGNWFCTRLPRGLDA
jgi:hypothetical protein